LGYVLTTLQNHFFMIIEERATIYDHAIRSGFPVEVQDKVIYCSPYCCDVNGDITIARRHCCVNVNRDIIFDRRHRHRCFAARNASKAGNCETASSWRSTSVHRVHCFRHLPFLASTTVITLY
jgi:hypothetical protein